MSKAKYLKLISFVLVGTVYFILQSQMKNLFQFLLEEFGLLIPGIAQLSPIIDLAETLQDVFIDSAVNRIMTLLGLIVSSWLTLRNREPG